MSEEKVVNEEVMSEEELDVVAGGTAKQVALDAMNIHWLEQRYSRSTLGN